MSQTVESKEFIYEFENFVLDPIERILLADGKPIHLTDKVFDTLLLLVHRNGRLVTKDEMMSSIWEESFVEEGNLAKNISRLRKILNVNGTSLIETLPRRGYRFAADVKEIDGDTSLLVRRNLRVKITQTDESENAGKREGEQTKQIERAVTSSRGSRLSIVVAAVLILAVLSGLGFYFWRSDMPIAQSEGGVLRLTDDPKNDNHPHWTTDGRIRFFRTGSDGRTRSLVMNADGSNQTEVIDLNNLDHGIWSPDETKVMFAKRGDQTAMYIANADGSNEVPLPFFGGNVDWSPDSKQIVYQKKISEIDAEIFVYSLETGKSENISKNPAFDADPSFAPDGKQIVFASGRDENAEIYLMNSDGSNVRRLTNHPSWDSHPVFSPDGTQIAFPSDRESENSDIYLMNSDGSGALKRLTDWRTDEYVEPGCWSPDGTRLAFSSNREGSDDIFIMSAEVFRPNLVLEDEKYNIQFPSLSPDGKEIAYQAETEDKSGELRIFDVETKQSRVLLKTPNPDIAPAYSPDGTWIAFQNRIESNTEICLINTDGSGLTNLTNNAARDANPIFSPDGKLIVFASNRGGNYGKFDLNVMDVDGSDQRQIYSSNLGMSVTPVWSPDGREIIFANDKENSGTGNFEIFKIRFDTSEPEQRLTFRRRMDTQPAVSPDGKRIAFVSNGDGNLEIYLMNSDGSGLLRLTRNSADDSTPRWLPDGTKIIFSSNRNGKYALYEIDLDR